MIDKTSSNGISCLTIVGIIFVTLKLLGVNPVATWSWLWVLSPFWAPAVICIAVVIFVICILIAGRKD